MVQRGLMILLIVVIVLGGGYYAFLHLVPPAEEEAQGPVYATKPVVRGDITVGVDASGPLNPSRSGGIQVPGGRGPGPLSGMSYIVEEVLVEEGDDVKQGQVVIRLSAPELQTQIENKEEELRMERRALADLLGISTGELAGVDPGRGVTLRAPIDGRVVGLKVEEGDEIKQGDIVARIVDDSSFHATATLLPGEIDQVVGGKRVLLRFPQFDGLVEARVTDVNPEPIPMPSSELHDSLPDVSEGEETGYQFVHWVEIEGENTGLIHPGMLAQVGVPAGTVGTLEQVRFFRYYAEVEGYAAEERVLSGANAIATRVYVHEMQKVEAGDPLISMAGEDARQMVKERLDKIRELSLEVDRLRGGLENLEIRAPMDGVVAHIDPQLGMTVQSGQWLGHIYNTSDMRMWVQVDDVDVLLVQQGAPVRVTVDALPGKTFEGEVEHVATMGEDQSGITRFRVTIKVEGGPELRPGMQAQAHIDAGSAEDVLLVPLEAIFEEDGQSKVEILEDGVPKVVPVELGLMNDRVAEVKSGLEEGQLVITGSTVDLLPSQTIRSRESLLPTGDEDGGEDSGGATGGGDGR